MLNKSNITQAIISSKNFILAKNINNFSNIIAPFEKQKDKFISNIVLPINQLHRINTLYEILPNISQYTVIDNIIKFDCTSCLPIDIFGDATEGYIHFNSIKQTKKEKVEIEIDPKIVFQNIDGEELFTITRDHKIKFKSDFFKVFPIILKSGFIFSTANKSNVQLFISALDLSKRYIGECSKYEITNVIQYILPLWPIFDIHISNTIQISFSEDFIQDLYKNEDKPILLYIDYNLEKPKEITIVKIGNGIGISI